MENLQLFAKKLLGNEHHKYDDKSFQKKVKVLNIVAIFIIIAIHILSKNTLIVILFEHIYIITYIYMLYFQSKKRYKTAYLIIGVGYTIIFLVSSILIGSQNQIEYLIFLPVLGITLFFNEKKVKRAFFIFIFLVFLVLKIIYIVNPESLLNMKFSPMFNFLNGAFIFGIVYFIVDKTFENTEIYHQELLIKNQEITDLNKTLEKKIEVLSQELDKKSKALKQSNKELKRFSYVAAHDLREPLRNIIAFSQLMNKDIVQQKYDKIDEYSDYIDWSVKRIDTITRDIVDYTELEDRINSVENVLLSDVIEEIILGNFSKRRDIIFNIGNMPNIKVNKVSITMLFTQLIENAIQYCDKPQPIVSIEYLENESFHQFNVTDNGIGIAPEYHEKIFVMFKRLDNDIQKHGSGIGLSIFKKIIDSYGGQIWLESSIGKGSTFSFTLPK